MKEYIMEVADNVMVTKVGQELVRCQDCKWRGHEDDSPKWIPCLAIKTNNDWFCADGERRTDDA